jgi:hypothetical protein
VSLPLFLRGWLGFAPPLSGRFISSRAGDGISYALVLEPKLPGRPFFKGVAYGTAIWFLNAFLVLPLTDEGIAGSRHINTVGLIAFALAHEFLSGKRALRISVFRQPSLGSLTIAKVGPSLSLPWLDAADVSRNNRGAEERR